MSLLLSGCASPTAAQKAKRDPTPLQKAEPMAAPVDTDGKISRLEQQVADLQKEVTAARPKIAKIDVIEQKFKDLSLGLDRIDATYNVKAVLASDVMPSKNSPLPVPVASQPEPLKAKPVAPVEIAPPSKPSALPTAPKASATASVSGGKVLKDLRLGEKKEFSRLVLDLGESTKVNYDIDNDEKILTIDVPGFKSEAAKTKSFPGSLLIASYQTSQDDKGAHIVIQLKKPAKIANYSTIDPTGGKMARAVLDIAAQ